MGQSTPATAALRAGGVSFELRTYAYDPNSDRVGLQAAQSLGEPPSRVLKTLIAQVDNTPVCLVLQSDREASMKRVAAALGGKSARMLTPSDAERLTGYKVGGVSPFGQKRKLRIPCRDHGCPRALCLCEWRAPWPAGQAGPGRPCPCKQCSDGRDCFLATRAFGSASAMLWTQAVRCCSWRSWPDGPARLDRHASYRTQSGDPSL